MRGELARTTFQLRMFADLAAAGGGRSAEVDEEVPGPPPAGHPELVLTRVPLGPVAVYGASNFPFAFSVPGGDVASALAAGCPVVAKAHPAHPQTSQRCADHISRGRCGAGLPGGLFGLVHGFEAGQRLVVDPRVRAAAFTGSGAGGRALFDAANGRPDPIPFYGELGSVNPVVVTPAGAADPVALVEGWLGSLTLGGGQFCTNPGLLLAPYGSGSSRRSFAQAPVLPAAVLLHDGIGGHLDRSVGVVEAAAGVHVLAEGAPGERAWCLASGPHPSDAGRHRARRPGRDRHRVLRPGGRGRGVRRSRPAARSRRRRSPAALSERFTRRTTSRLLRRWCRRWPGSRGGSVWNGWPTGVAVTAGQHHGGPWPATTNPLHTSVGTAAVDRFTRPVAFQSVPHPLLPAVGRTLIRGSLVQMSDSVPW